MFNPLDEYDRVAQTVESGLYQCTLCGHCTATCPKNINVVEGIILTRQRTAEKGMVPDSVKKVYENIMKTDNLHGTSKDHLAAWAKGLNIPKKGNILLFASCYYTATEEARSVLKVAMGILKNLRYKAGYLGREEPCCGVPLYLYGYIKEFKEKAAETNKTFVKHGVNEIVTLSPMCAYAFKELYPKYVKNFKIKTKTFIEVFVDKLKAGAVRLNGIREKAVVYHDSNYLAKFLGIVEEPRLILRSIPGLKIVEPGYNYGVNAISDGYMGADEDVHLKIAQKRLEQLLGTGVNTVVTADASDLIWLRKAAQSLGRKDVEIIDLIELLGKSIKR